MASTLFITGLCVLAPRNVKSNQADKVDIFLVDARVAKKSCGAKKLTLRPHRPLLSYDGADRLKGSTKQPDEIVPAPGGGEVHLCCLDLQTVTIRGRGKVTLENTFDACVPSLQKIDADIVQLDTSEAIAEASFQGGTLKPIFDSKDQWQIGSLKSQLANGVKLELAAGIEIDFGKGEVLMLEDKAAANLSNLPSTPPKKHGKELPHFLWYYRLAKWKSACKDHVPTNISLPMTAGSGICPQGRWP